MTPDDDPGWPHGPALLLIMLPGALQWQPRRRRNADGLVALRQLFLSFCIALIAFGVVLPFLQLRGGSVLPWLAALCVLAIVSIGGGRFVEKPLDGQTDAALAASYRTRFFLRIAFAESVALFAFVFVFNGAPLWIYYLGAALALARFVTAAAPTRAALARDQEALFAAGCSRSLVGALRTTPPSRP